MAVHHVVPNAGNEHDVLRCPQIPEKETHPCVRSYAGKLFLPQISAGVYSALLYRFCFKDETSFCRSASVLFVRCVIFFCRQIKCDFFCSHRHFPEIRWVFDNRLGG